jgi:hypothetical protein
MSKVKYVYIAIMHVIIVLDLSMSIVYVTPWSHIGKIRNRLHRVSGL